jgi:hypothetical protein
MNKIEQERIDSQVREHADSLALHRRVLAEHAQENRVCTCNARAMAFMSCPVHT